MTHPAINIADILWGMPEGDMAVESLKIDKLPSDCKGYQVFFRHKQEVRAFVIFGNRKEEWVLGKNEHSVYLKIKVGVIFNEIWT